MRRAGSRVAFGMVVALAFASSPGRAELKVVQRAEAAVASGEVEPERDLAPLLAALADARDVEEKRELVDAIADLGEVDGESPNLVKSYLRENAPPVLLEVIETGNDPFLQGDAVFALRGMGVSRAILVRAASLAEADPDAYVQSRGEILRGFIASLPEEDPEATVGSVDEEGAAAAIAYLDKRHIAVVTESLRDAAKRADADAVRALLAAGVAPDTGLGSLGETPLGYATSHACTSQGAETDWLVETVELLVAAGADLAQTDDNDNTALVNAVHWCGPRLVALLADAGVPLDHRNGSGLSPLGLALITGKLASAEVLVEKGARLGPEEASMMENGVTDPRARELLERARRPMVEAAPR